MKAEYINPFVTATINVFTTMVDCPVQRGEIYLKDGNLCQEEVTGVIGLSGKAQGVVAVHMSSGLAIYAAGAMLGETPSGIDEDVIDVIGEITNMISGAAKAELVELELSVSLPTVIRGPDHTLDVPSSISMLGIPFTSEHGNLFVEVGMDMSK